jgi:hypothetical protein
MGLAENLVRIAVSAVILAGWAAFIQPALPAILGRQPQYFDYLIAFLILFTTIFIATNFAIRSLREE